MTAHGIPIRTYVESTESKQLNAGTAFLAEHQGITYLITAAHVPVGDHPTTDWGRWDGRMTLHVERRHVNIELFHSGVRGERVPAFGYREIDTAPGKVHDVMWWPLLDNWSILLEELGQDHAVFPLSRPSNAQDNIAAHGFPSEVDIWPSHSVAPGHVVATSGLLHLTTSPTSNGFSGGPVVGADGLLVGMTIGTDDEGRSQVVATDVMRFLVEEGAEKHGHSRHARPDTPTNH